MIRFIDGISIVYDTQSRKVKLLFADKHESDAEIEFLVDVCRSQSNGSFTIKLSDIGFTMSSEKALVAEKCAEHIALSKLAVEECMWTEQRMKDSWRLAAILKTGSSTTFPVTRHVLIKGRKEQNGKTFRLN